MENYLSRGDIIRRNGEWLIVDISDDFCLLVLLNTTKTKIICYRVSVILNWLDLEEAELFVKEYDIESHTSVIKSAACVRIDDRTRSMATELLEREENLFWLAEKRKRIAFMDFCIKKYEISEYTVRRFLRDYLQNNLSLRKMECHYDNCGGKGKIKVFRNGKRSGRIGISQVERNETVIVQFETMLKKYMQSKKKISYRMLYMDFCQKYYSTKKVVNGEYQYDLYAAVNRPSQRQLCYFIRTHASDAEIYEAHHGEKEARNNIRALSSDTIADLTHKTIGSRYEMDEMETDFYLVSRYDSSQIIGRAILYVLVDVYSKMITGIHVGLDNNSWDGAKMALLNMAEDKVEVCRRAGIDIEEEDWPVSEVLPYEIETDNGSEYMSIPFEKYAAENGIRLAFVPSRMGSLKPNVEQKFHQFNTFVKGRLPGEIKKDQYGAPHIKGARLTIEDFYKIVLEFVLTYNKTPMENYQADKEIFVAGISMSPNNIWNFKCNRTTALKKIHDMNEYKFSLLGEGNASITREGILFKKIIYTCDDQQWLSGEMSCVSLSGRKKLKIRYDRRNMDFIYFILDGKIVRGYMNQRKIINEKYVGCSLKEVEFINKILKKHGELAVEDKMQNRIAFNAKIDAIVKESKKKHSGKNSNKYISVNRAIEKQQLHKETQICIETEGALLPENIRVLEERKTESCQQKMQEIDIKKLSRAELFALQRDMEIDIHTKN